MNVNLLNARICISSEGLSALITFIAFERPKGLAIELRLPDPTGIRLDEETKDIKWKLLLVIFFRQKKKKTPSPLLKSIKCRPRWEPSKRKWSWYTTGTEALDHWELKLILLGPIRSLLSVSLIACSLPLEITGQ